MDWFKIFIVIALITLHSFATDYSWKHLGLYEGVELYTSSEASGDILPFKAVATFQVPAEKIVMAVLDYDKKKLWATRLKSLKMHKIIGPGHFLFSEYYSAPWPLEDREFLMEGKVSKNGNITTFLGQSSPEHQFRDKKHILADIKLMQLDVIKIDEDTTRLELSFMGNPKGYIPTWFINMVQKSFPGKFLHQLVEHAKSAKNVESAAYTTWVKSLSLVTESSERKITNSN